MAGAINHGIVNEINEQGKGFNVCFSLAHVATHLLHSMYVSHQYSCALNCLPCCEECMHLAGELTTNAVNAACLQVPSSLSS